MNCLTLIKIAEEMKYIKLHITVELPLHKVTLRGVLAWCSITLSYNKSPGRRGGAFLLLLSTKIPSKYSFNC